MNGIAKVIFPVLYKCRARLLALGFERCVVFFQPRVKLDRLTKDLGNLGFDLTLDRIPVLGCSFLSNEAQFVSSTDRSIIESLLEIVIGDSFADV
jgi:hypothetical protein